MDTESTRRPALDWLDRACTRTTPIAGLVIAFVYVGFAHWCYYTTPDLALELDMQSGIKRMAPGVEKATGLRKGDRLQAIILPGGERIRVKSAFHWLQLYAQVEVGSTVGLEVRRPAAAGAPAVTLIPRVRAQRKALWPSLLITGGSFLVNFIICFLMWLNFRGREGIGWLIVVILNTYVVAYGFTHMHFFSGSAPLFLSYLLFDLFTLPLLLHLFLKHPVPFRWVRTHALRPLLLYVPQVVITVISAVLYLRLFRDPTVANQEQMILFSGYLLPFAFFGYLLSAVGVMIYRFVTSTPALRKQIQWIIYGFVLTAILTVAFAVYKVQSASYEDWIFNRSEYLLVIYALLATTIACSFVSFRRIDVDRLVHRSLVYGLVTGFVGLIYLAATGLLGLVLTKIFGWTSTRVSVAATLVAAALFFPLRRAVQANVDRVFFKNRGIYSDILRKAQSEFVTMLQLDRLSATLLGMLEAKLNLRHTALFLADANGVLQHVHSVGEDSCEQEPAGAGLRVGDARLKALRDSSGNVAVSRRYREEEGADGPEDAFAAFDASVIVFLEVGESTLGLLVLGAKKDDAPVSRDEEETLQALGQQLSVVVKNASAYTEIDRLSQDLRKRQREILELKNRLEAENVYLREAVSQASRFGDIVGQSEPLNEVLALVSKVAGSEATVLIQGESGTGKELIARAIHGASSRRDRPLVTINCAAIPEGLLESELFGHMKGAFTGASSRKRGRFELADGGTLFLDEVGDMPLSLQPKLLRALQEKEIVAVGGEKASRIDVRVIAATNRNLEQRVGEGQFREDLFYRLNVIPLALPPLRERTDDIPLLANYFLELFARRNAKTLTGISKHAMDRMRSYHWPGNVRELANVVERAVVLSNRPILDDEIVLSGQAPVADSGMNAEPTAIEELIPYQEAVNDFKRRYLTEAIRRSGGNRAAAARELGLQRTYLYRLIRQLNVPAPG